MQPLLSVIIPLAPGEQAWRTLIPQMETLMPDTEILLLSANSGDIELLAQTFIHHQQIKVIPGKPGRAQLMNTGAQVARGQYLWFLHADTRLPENYNKSLLESIHQQRQAIYYFDLEFLNDGPAAMRLTSKGVYFRSHCLHLPFGDQALLMSRNVFKQLGGYNESAQFGEDHLLVWQAHLQAIPVLPIGNTIFTSARKYRRHGWLATSLLHVFLTVQQALPPLYQWVKLRLRGRRFT